MSGNAKNSGSDYWIVSLGEGVTIQYINP
jgi:hypothetical protein